MFKILTALQRLHTFLSLFSFSCWIKSFEREFNTNRNYFHDMFLSSLIEELENSIIPTEFPLITLPRGVSNQRYAQHVLCKQASWINLGCSERSATVIKGLQLQAANVSGELQQPGPRYQAWGDDMMWRGSVINWACGCWADLYAASAECLHCANNVSPINWLSWRSIDFQESVCIRHSCCYTLEIGLRWASGELFIQCGCCDG